MAGLVDSRSKAFPLTPDPAPAAVRRTFSSGAERGMSDDSEEEEGERKVINLSGDGLLSAVPDDLDKDVEARAASSGAHSSAQRVSATAGKSTPPSTRI